MPNSRTARACANSAFRRKPIVRGEYRHFIAARSGGAQPPCPLVYAIAWRRTPAGCILRLTPTLQSESFNAAVSSIPDLHIALRACCTSHRTRPRTDAPGRLNKTSKLRLSPRKCGWRFEDFQTSWLGIRCWPSLWRARGYRRETGHYVENWRRFEESIDEMSEAQWS